VGDFNGDGRLDLAVPSAQGTDQIWILLQAPTVTLSSSGLDFGMRVVGTRSAPQTLTLSNASVLALKITNIAIAGTNASDFSQTNTCGSGVPAGGQCTTSVAFAPTQIGPRSASLTIKDNAEGTPQVITVSGTGVISGPNATVSATSLTFATEPLGITSGMQSVTLTDFGTATLNIASIVVTGVDRADFAQSNNCGSALAPGGSCTVNVSFTPTQAGSRTATITISDNSSGSPQTVSLSGTGTVIQLNPVSLNFGVLPVIGQSRTLTATLTNRGSTALGISSITIAGTDADEFHQTNGCGSSLGPGASCTISVTFRPTELGLDSAHISISDTASGSPQQISLSGYCGRIF
jgi:hypothetical protein